MERELAPTVFVGSKNSQYSHGGTETRRKGKNRKLVLDVSLWYEENLDSQSLTQIRMKNKKPNLVLVVPLCLRASVRVLAVGISLVLLE
jgi:hypothetical protein